MTDLASLDAPAAALVQACQTAGLMISTAESCTGGMIAAAITGVPGASAVFERGFVTYANEAKTAMLGVATTLLAEHGAVSEAVARAMAAGALDHSPADLAVAVTGIAGPTGGTPEKPVGLVHFATARRGGPVVHAVHVFAQLDRDGVRLAAARQALTMLAAAALEPQTP